MSLSVFLLAQVAALQASPVELIPSSQWQVEYAKSSCVVSRAFGEKPNQILFGLKPALNSEFVSLLVVQPSRKGRGVRGEAEVKLSGGFIPESADYTSVTANGMRVTTISVPSTTLDQLAKGDAIAIKAGEWVDVTLHPTAADKALAALKECEADLLESWGYSRAAQAAVAEPPKGSLQGLFRVDDYPMDLVAMGIQGSVGLRLRIEPDGKISECSIMESSGNANLDSHTCALAKRRARYTPAMGYDRNPVWSFTFANVTWMLE